MGVMYVGVVVVQGFVWIDVWVVLCVGILMIGDELVVCGQLCVLQQIYNSNVLMFVVLVVGIGVDVVMSLYVVDMLVVVEWVLCDLYVWCDFVICVGGVLVGDKDLLCFVLVVFGVLFFVIGVCMKFGKLVVFVWFDVWFVVLLFGNLGVVMMVFVLFVVLLICCLQGCDVCLLVVLLLLIDIGFELDVQCECFVCVWCIVGVDGVFMFDMLCQ